MSSRGRLPREIPQAFTKPTQEDFESVTVVRNIENDDGPVMLPHVAPQQTMTTIVEVGYAAPEPAEMIEETRIYLDNLVDSVWNPETGHVSKTDLTNALMNMAGYAYSRGYQSGWHKALDAVRRIVDGFTVRGG